VPYRLTTQDQTMPDTIALHERAIQAMAEHIAACIVWNATDNDEDPLTYSTDAEIVELYCKDAARDISGRLGEEVKKIVAR